MKKRTHKRRPFAIILLCIFMLTPFAIIVAAQVTKQAPVQPTGGGEIIWAIDSYIYNEEDPTDWYFFHAPDAGPFVIVMSNIPRNCDFDLYLYEQLEGQAPKRIGYSGEWGVKEEIIELSAVPGRKYLVQVLPDQKVPNNYSSTTKYHLEMHRK